MPYRIDLAGAPDGAVEALIELGALDVDAAEGGIAALMPDTVSVASIVEALGVTTVQVGAAVGRDDGSVWALRPPVVRTRSLVIVPADMPAPPAGSLRLIDGRAFGTGLHPTTALCLDAIEDAVDVARPERVLDVGTGSGILALAALRLGVPDAAGVEIDAAALAIAAENARLNGFESRLQLVRGDVRAATGRWPFIVANIRAAELIEMAPALVRHTASRGRVVLSGIPRSVAPDVQRACERLGLKCVQTRERGGWVALELVASW